MWQRMRDELSDSLPAHPNRLADIQRDAITQNEMKL